MIDAAALEELGLRPPDAAPPPSPSLGLIPRLRSWLWVHRKSILVAAPLLVVVGVVQSTGMTRSPMPSDDEGTYVAQAWAVQVQHRLAHYTYWYDHPPLGWIQIAAWTWLTGAFHRVGHAVMAGRELMVVATVVATALTYIVARRMGMRRPWAVAAVVLFAFSPLAVANHRAVLLDNLGVVWMLAAFALAMSPRRSLWAAAGSGFCFAVAVLSKETFLVLVVAVVYLLWHNCDRRTRSFCITAFTTVFGLVLAAYPLYALLKGELLPGAGHVSLIDAIRFQLFSRAPSGSVFAHGTPAHRTVMSWLDLDRWLLAGGLVMLPLGLAVRRLRPLGIAIAMEVVAVVRGGYLPGPYVIGILPFAALLVAGAGDWAWGASGDRAARRRAGVAALAVIAMVGVARPWVEGDRQLLTANPTANWSRAERWVIDHVPRDQRVLVDDAMWLDLVHHGWDPRAGVIWFSKLGGGTGPSSGTDPSVAKVLPHGWEDISYVISTPTMRGSVAGLPAGMDAVHATLAHSKLVARFGAGINIVEVRQVEVPEPARPAQPATTSRRGAP